ncbi:MAG TPA: 2-amino-4-hydroxy-6-hydroxymethyldihydropteridine diphosphokinase [Spirochaetia bacterium]|nr:2-amino-4-hydroxy-6-hydroxymethyldihydropteridine diphosphokinase [Spirochaetia bacterium]
MEIAYIGVGSNIGPEENISNALRLLASSLSVTGISPFYRSKAVGTVDQPDFVNGVFRIRTGISARKLKFNVLRGIEDRLGRVRNADKNAPRTIDLDLLLYGELILQAADLTLPDPELTHYPFVGVPLKELEPTLRVPGTGKLLNEIFPLSPDAYDLVLLSDFTDGLRIIR